MGDFSTCWGELAQARRDALQATGDGQPPPHTVAIALTNWVDLASSLPEGELTAEALAQVWGNLQLVLIGGGQDVLPESIDAMDYQTTWRRLRRLVEQAYIALLERPEWSSLRDDFRDEILPLLADAINREREGRALRCREAVARLRALALRTSGHPHAWRVHRVAEMQYPLITPEGWRGRIDIEFTARRVQAFTQALLAEIGQDELKGLPLVVGYDSRLSADAVARQVTEVATSAGYPVHLCQRDVPTPALIDYLCHTLTPYHSAGIVVCTAGSLPMRELNERQYAGHGYSGLRYLLPTGQPPSEDLMNRVSQRMATLLLEPVHASANESAGAVMMFQPQEAYLNRLLMAMNGEVATPEGDRETVRQALRNYWGQTDALVVIDEMHGATRGYLAALCSQLGIPHAVIHGNRQPLFGRLGAADTEPPYLDDVKSYVLEQCDAKDPLIGLAFDAEGRQLGVVDEQGEILPASVLPVLLTEYLLAQGREGFVVRSYTGPHFLDQLLAQPVYTGQVQPPLPDNALPEYMHERGYRQLIGNPQAMQHGPVRVERHLRAMPDGLLLGGDTHGHIMLQHEADADALRAALLLLQLCAVQRTGIGALWRELQRRNRPPYIELAQLRAPAMIRSACINTLIDRYERLERDAVPVSTQRLGRCTIQYVGGMRDTFVEWAVRDEDATPAFITLAHHEVEGALHLHAEAAAYDTAHHLIVAVGEQLQKNLEDTFRRSETPWRIIDILSELTSPSSVRGELPGMLTCPLAGEAYSRIQELARPGRPAPELWRFVLDQLSERQSTSAITLAACHLGERSEEKKTPPPPRVHWESEGEGG